MATIRIGDIAAMALRPRQGRFRSCDGNPLFCVLLSDGLMPAEKQKLLATIRAHEDITVARLARGGLVWVETRPGSDDQSILGYLRTIKGIEQASRRTTTLCKTVGKVPSV